MKNLKFRKKSLVTQETLGELLVKVRSGKNWSIKKAATETRIALHYLKALEEARYDDIPGEVYIKNFIIAYSKRLGLNQEESLKMYLRERHIMRGKNFHRSLNEIGSQSFLQLLLNPPLLKTAAICSVISVMLSYIAVNVYSTVAPPSLIILHPKENMETKMLSLTVAGKSDPEAEVIINSELTIMDKDGMFEETVRLRDGLNLIVILAKRKHGMEKKIIRHILVEQNNLSLMYD